MPRSDRRPSLPRPRLAAYHPALGSWGRALLAVVGLLGIFANDRFLRAGEVSLLRDALTDEPAHAITALLAVGALAAWRPAWRARAIGVAALLGGTAIDLDHLPDALGWHGLSVGTDRPDTHALPTLLLLLGIALSRHGARRRVLLAAALGLATHFLRDLVEGSTLPLLWPVTKHGFTMAYGWYAAVAIICVGATIGRAIVATAGFAAAAGRSR